MDPYTALRQAHARYKARHQLFAPQGPTAQEFEKRLPKSYVIRKPKPAVDIDAIMRTDGAELDR